MKIFAIFVALILLCGLGIAYWRTHQPVAVSVVKVTRDTIEVGCDEDGTVRSNTEGVVAARISSRVRSISVHDGARVSAGQVIATLDESAVRAAIEAADADAARAADQLRETHVNVRSEVQRAETGVAEARAALARARAQQARVEHGPLPAERARARAVQSQTQAALWEARRQYQRARKLYGEGYVPLREVDATRAAWRQARSRVRQSEADLQLVTDGSRTEDRRAAAAEVAQQEAGVAQALATLARADSAAPQMEAAAAAFQAAQARAQEARAQLRDVVLTAPCNGTCNLATDVSVGDVVAPGTLIARVVDPSRLYVEAQIDERDMAAVHVGMKALMTSDTWPDLTFAGRLIRIGSEAMQKRSTSMTAGREEDRIFKGRITLSDPRNRLRPGMSLYVDLITRTVRNALVVPREALVAETGSVWAVEGGCAVQRSLQLGVRDARRVQVKSGLRDGDEVIIGGRELLREGIRVRTSPAPAQ